MEIHECRVLDIGEGSMAWPFCHRRTSFLVTEHELQHKLLQVVRHSAQFASGLLNVACPLRCALRGCRHNRDVLSNLIGPL